MSIFGLRSLPDEIFQTLRDYLRHIDYVCFISCSKLFEIVRQKTIKLQLKEANAINYLINSRFRSKIQTMIHDPFQQLKLEILFGIKSNNLSLIVSEIPSKISVNSLSISNSDQPFPFLSNFPELTNLTIVRDCSQRSDLLSLQKLQKLRLFDITYPNDASFFHNIQEITIRRCKLPTDISILRNAKILVFQDIYSKIDVNSLGNVYDLRLENCRGVDNISSLTKNTKITIMYCPQIRDYTSIKNAKYIEIGIESRGIDLTCLPKIDRLTCVRETLFNDDPNQALKVNLERVDSIRLVILGDGSPPDFTRIKNIPTVEIEYEDGGSPAPLLHQLRGNHSIKNLSLEYEQFKEPFDIAIANHISVVSIAGLNITSSSTEFVLEGVREMKISDSIITSFSCFRNVYHLILRFLKLADQITSYDGLSDIPIIEIDKKSYIKDLKGLGNNEKIIIHGINDKSLPFLPFKVSDGAEFDIPSNLQGIDWLIEHYQLDESRRNHTYLKRLLEQKSSFK